MLNINEKTQKIEIVTDEKIAMMKEDIELLDFSDINENQTDFDSDTLSHYNEAMANDTDYMNSNY